MTRLLHRLRARFRNRDFDNELREELRLHEELKREELEAAGMARDDARAAARRALGNATLMREDSRGIWIAPWLESVVQDVRYAIRTLWRQPLHSATAVAVLVLAIGMSSTLFAFLKATSLAPWPVKDPSRVVRVWARAGAEFLAPSVDEYRFMRDHATTLSGAAAYFEGSQARLQAPGQSETYPPMQLVSANFLELMGARIRLGTGFLAEDDQPGMRRTVLVISGRLWRTYFDADPDVVGRTIQVNRTTFTVIGVLDGSFDGLSRPVDVWLPLSAVPATNMVSAAGIEPSKSANCCIRMVARLADGVDRERARQELQILHERFTAAGKRKSGIVEVFGTAYADMPGRNDLDALGLVVAALGLVLVLACANVGNLQLARGIARRREIATRTAIGASRARVVRQLIVEGLVLAGIAGGIALAIAAIAPAAYLRARSPVPGLLRAPVGVEWPVVVVTAGLCVVASLMFALAPALHATRRTIPLGTLDRGSTRRARFHLRGGFLAIQIAVCTVLLIGAGLVTRAIAHAAAFDPGFTVDGIQRVSVLLPSELPNEQRRLFERQLLDALERNMEQPIASGSPGPFTDFPFRMGVALPGEAPQHHRQVARRSVSGRYFEVLGIPILRGRMFASDATGEVVVNEAFARTHWRGEDLLGQTIRHIDDKGAVASTLTIVGVVRDAYLSGLERIEPIVFRPTTGGTLITNGDAATMERIRALARALNPHATVRAWPLSDDVREYLEESRFGAIVAWGIGLLGLLLAAVGVLGVFAYAVEERRREIGVRLALGAARGHIVRMLVSTSGRGMLLGLAVGLLLSLACGPLLRSHLFGLHPLDPIAYAGVLSLLAATGAIATVVPARRACRVDPSVTLRDE